VTAFLALCAPACGAWQLYDTAGGDPPAAGTLWANGIESDVHGSVVG
jgi:hypothetical protein